MISLLQRPLFLRQLLAVAALLIALPAGAADARKSPESYLAEGISCLQASDFACAQVALANIPSQSPYAKILDGSMAAASGDTDRTFRLLLPLQANQSLAPQASASLHASLALAYEKQGDPLRALEQSILAENYLQGEAAIQASHTRIWGAVAKLPGNQLVEMRGESSDTITQGWIDLALAAQSGAVNVRSWQAAYPDHPASALSEKLLEGQPAPAAAPVAATPAASPVTAPVRQIALILPFLVESFYSASDAIERGFNAAQGQDTHPAIVKSYATSGKREEIAAVYRQAVQEGATAVVGPLTRDEVTELAALERLDVPTLALNSPDGLNLTHNLYTYGLAIDNEAQQIVRLARSLGMQTATIVVADSPLEARMAKAFSDAWIADGGQVRLQVGVTATSDLASVRNDVAMTPSDVIFLAADADDARRLRPYLDAATPTFALSHVYSGLAHNPDDSALTAVRFVDMPWLLKPDGNAAAYKTAAGDLPAGEMQRWFALGVDAYRLAGIISSQAQQPASFEGLTGRVRISESGDITRELSVASFSRNGVILEKSP